MHAICGITLSLIQNISSFEIVPANHTSTTQFVFGEERSLFPHPKTRNINHGKSKEINLSDTAPVAKKDRNWEGGWEKNYTR